MLRRPCISFFFFFNDTATTEIYTLSLHDALPISRAELAILRLECLQEMEDFGLRQFGECEVVARRVTRDASATGRRTISINRSEEHTSELQSPCNLVCRLLLEKKKNRQQQSRRCA